MWLIDTTPMNREYDGKIIKSWQKTFGAVYFAYKRLKEYYFYGGYNGRGVSGTIAFPSLRENGEDGMEIWYSKYTSERHLPLVRDIKE